MRHEPLSAWRGWGSALPPPRPRPLAAPWVRGCGWVGSWAPGWVHWPPSPQGRMAPGTALQAGEAWPALRLEAVGRRRHLSFSEAAGRQWKLVPKKTEVGPSARKEVSSQVSGELLGQRGARGGDRGWGQMNPCPQGPGSRPRTSSRALSWGLRTAASTQGHSGGEARQKPSDNPVSGLFPRHLNLLQLAHLPCSKARAWD